MLSPDLIRKILLAGMILAGGIFVLSSFAVYRGRFTTADFAATVKLQDKFPTRYDDNVALLVDLGSMEIQGIVFLVVLALLPIRKREKLVLLGIYAAGLVFVLAGKTLLHHPAPPFLFQRLSKGLPFPSMHVQVDYSYPSGHTYRTVFLSTLMLATALVSTSRQKILWGIGILTTLLTILVLVGLIVLGKHWTSDVIGGGSLAVFLVMSCFAGFSFFKSR